MTSYGYIIMIIVDSCMIWFDYDCIMQLKKSFHIATNVCSRKGATTSLTDHKMWDGITYPFLNFSDEVWKCIRDFIPHFTDHVVTYLGLKLIRTSKRGPWIWLRWQLNQAQQNWTEIERKFSIHAFHHLGKVLYLLYGIGMNWIR